MVTTIQLDEGLKSRLDKLKIHHRETYNELILRLISPSSQKNLDKESLIETIELLSDPQTMRDIAEALEEYEQGKGIEFSKLKKELRINV